MNRREFLGIGTAAVAGLGIAAPGLCSRITSEPAKDFKISLAEWSLHRALFGKQMDNLDFPKSAREEYGIEAVRSEERRVGKECRL